MTKGELIRLRTYILILERHRIRRDREWKVFTEAFAKLGVSVNEVAKAFKQLRYIKK